MRVGPTVPAFLLLTLLSLVSTHAFADSIQSIAISGAGWKGQPNGNCCINGDFLIAGPSLSLGQGTPDGPTSIGVCQPGAVCDFSYSVGNTTTFCTYCSGLSWGSLGSRTAEYLDPSLTFTGSAFYTGGDTMTVPMAVSGTIVGYQLNCSIITGCTLGPVQFRLRIVGQGDAVITLRSGTILGAYTTFTGTARIVPEPVSLVLTATGLVGVWLRRSTTLKLGSGR